VICEQQVQKSTGDTTIDSEMPAGNGVKHLGRVNCLSTASATISQKRAQWVMYPLPGGNSRGGMVGNTSKLSGTY